MQKTTDRETDRQMSALSRHVKDIESMFVKSVCRSAVAQSAAYPQVGDKMAERKLVTTASQCSGHLRDGPASINGIVILEMGEYYFRLYEETLQRISRIMLPQE